MKHWVLNLCVCFGSRRMFFWGKPINFAAELQLGAEAGFLESWILTPNWWTSGTRFSASARSSLSLSIQSSFSCFLWERWFALSSNPINNESFQRRANTVLRERDWTKSHLFVLLCFSHRMILSCKSFSFLHGDLELRNVMESIWQGIWIWSVCCFAFTFCWTGWHVPGFQQYCRSGCHSGQDLHRYHPSPPHHITGMAKLWKETFPGSAGYMREKIQLQSFELIAFGALFQCQIIRVT